MKKIFTLILPLRLLPAMFCLLLLGACQEEETIVRRSPNGVLDVDIATFVERQSTLSLLNAALKRTGLDATLRGTEQYTLFAPLNPAFEAYLRSVNAPTIDDVPIETLTTLLSNHVLVGKFMSTDLTEVDIPQPKTAISGLNMTVQRNLFFDVTILPQGRTRAVTVLTSNIEPTNGSVHIVNQLVQ